MTKNWSNSALIAAAVGADILEPKRAPKAKTVAPAPVEEAPRSSKRKRKASAAARDAEPESPDPPKSKRLRITKDVPANLSSANENDLELYKGRLQGESILSLQTRIMYGDKKSAPVTIKGRVDTLKAEWKENGSAKMDGLLFEAVQDCHDEINGKTTFWRFVSQTMLQNHGITISDEDARSRYHRVLDACFVRTHIDLHLQPDNDEDKTDAHKNDVDETGPDTYNYEAEAEADDEEEDEVEADDQEAYLPATQDSLFVDVDNDEGDTVVEAEAKNDELEQNDWLAELNSTEGDPANMQQVADYLKANHETKTETEQTVECAEESTSDLACEKQAGLDSE